MWFLVLCNSHDYLSTVFASLLYNSPKSSSHVGWHGMAHLPSEVFNSSSVVTEPPSKQLPCVNWPIDACCTYKSRDLPLVHHTRSCFCCRQKVISWSASWFLQEVGRLLSDFGRLVGREKETGELLSAFVLSPSWSKNCSAFHRHTQIIWTRERLQRWEQLINTGDSYRTDFRERNIIPLKKPQHQECFSAPSWGDCEMIRLD